uniref:Uncharacterized protein n=1 Tax=Magallana gigas TaxID=29159 RepID=A0A8W8KM74_MAGGI
MTTSGVALFALAAVLFLAEPVASQMYQQATYGQGVYAQYPRPMIVPAAPQSDITVFIIPIILIVLVIVCIPVLIGSSSSTFEKETTTKHPYKPTTEEEYRKYPARYPGY